LVVDARRFGAVLRSVIKVDLAMHKFVLGSKVPLQLSHFFVSTLKTSGEGHGKHLV